jgi:hypothetical protein
MRRGCVMCIWRLARIWKPVKDRYRKLIPELPPKRDILTSRIVVWGGSREGRGECLAMAKRGYNERQFYGYCGRRCLTRWSSSVGRMALVFGQFYRVTGSVRT